MRKGTEEATVFPVESARDALTAVLREGAQRLLAEAVEAEAQEWIAERVHLRDRQGHREVVRNGYHRKRAIQTGLGAVDIHQPRVRDRRPADQAEPFTSKLLPPYLRRTKSVEELLPWLYLKGISTGGFGEALAALLGPNAPGLSATTITRLTASWRTDYAQWSHRSLAGKAYVYVWADGVHFNIRLEEAGNKRQCILVLIGATADGGKELVAISDGYGESEQSWKELLLDVGQRGLTRSPKLAVGDGALGFWAAMRKLWPETREQRCWVHKTANVLSKMPKGVRGKAKAMLHDIWMAETRAAANRAFDLFVKSFDAKYPRATACLVKDRGVLLTFYDFPAEHWVHLRTTNPIESTFATVRLRTNKTKGCGSRAACLAMVFKLTQSAAKKWRTLNGSQLITDVIRGAVFVDGIKKDAA